MSGLLTARAVADLLGVSPEWVRAHAADLGATRLHHGPKAPLRFDPDRVRSYLDAHRVERQAPPVPPRRPGPKPSRAWAESVLPLPKGAR